MLVVRASCSMWWGERSAKLLLPPSSPVAINNHHQAVFPWRGMVVHSLERNGSPLMVPSSSPRSVLASNTFAPLLSFLCNKKAFPSRISAAEITPHYHHYSTSLRRESRIMERKQSPTSPTRPEIWVWEP